MLGMLTRPVTKHLATCCSEWKYEPFTGWVPVNGVNVVKAIIKAFAVIGSNDSSITLQMCMQTAEMRSDKPGAWSLIHISQAVGNQQELLNCTGELTSLSLSSSTLVRFGIAFKAAANETAQADVTLQVSYNALGSPLGQKSVTVESGTTSVRALPLTGWMPVLKAEKFNIGMHIANYEGEDLQWRPTYQLAEVEPECPGNWSTSWSSWQDVSEGEDLVSSLQLSSHENYMWVRVGILYRSEAGDWGQAEMNASVVGWV